MAVGKETLTHHFHADANAIGATITKPEGAGVFPVQSSVSLPPVGGLVSYPPSKDFCFEAGDKAIISARLSHSEVHGHFEAGYPITNSCSRVENLHVVQRVKANSVTGQITSEHPPAGKRGYPKISFREPKLRSYGTRFGDSGIQGLTIDGKAIEVILDLDFLSLENGNDHLDRPHLHHEKLWEKIKRAYNSQTGSVRCTLVRNITGADNKVIKFIPPNILEVDELGRIYFAELEVQYHLYRLTMIRFELGCPVIGNASMATVAAEGHGGP